MVNQVTVKAPSSTANLGPGFDVYRNYITHYAVLTKSNPRVLVMKSCLGTYIASTSN